jgi:hypothetical protein
VTPQSLPIPQIQVPSPPSSSLCQEKTQRRPVKPYPSGFTGPTTTRKPWCTSNRVALCSYPVHRSLPPTRRSSSDGSVVPGEAQDKPPNPHAKLSLLRATRIVPAVTIYYVFGSYCSGMDRTCSGIGILEVRHCIRGSAIVPTHSHSFFPESPKVVGASSYKDGTQGLAHRRLRP